MVDVSDKKILKRKAVAEGRLKLKTSTLKAIREEKTKKGDVVTISQVAGIQAAKDTSNIIPLCHQIPLSSVDVQLDFGRDCIIARTTVIASNVTGVEMEALVGTSVALLNVWDMVKYLEKDKNGQYPMTEIFDIRVLEKRKEET